MGEMENDDICCPTQCCIRKRSQVENKCDTLQSQNCLKMRVTSVTVLKWNVTKRVNSHEEESTVMNEDAVGTESRDWVLVERRSMELFRVLLTISQRPGRIDTIAMLLTDS